MLRITVECDRPAGQAIGIKEAIAQDMEKYGDVHVTSVQDIEPEQLKIQDTREHTLAMKYAKALGDLKICSFAGGCAICRHNKGGSEHFDCRKAEFCNEDNNCFEWRGLN